MMRISGRNLSHKCAGIVGSNQGGMRVAATVSGVASPPHAIHNHVPAPQRTASYGILNQAGGFVVASNVHGLDVTVAAFAKEVAS